MKKAFKIILLFVLVNCFNGQKINAMNMWGDKNKVKDSKIEKSNKERNQDINQDVNQDVKAKFEIINETNKTTESKGVLNDISTFDLKITIPNDWKLYSNEAQEIGKPLSILVESLDIELKQHDAMNKKQPKLEITYPKSEEDYPFPNDKTKVNHVYKGEITIGIKTEYYNQRDKELLIDYTMCSKEKCINHKENVRFGLIDSKEIIDLDIKKN